MTIQRAMTVLKEYNDWRRGEHEPCDCKYSSMEIGAAIDLAVYYLWKVKEIIKIIEFGDGGEHINFPEEDTAQCDTV